MLFVRAPRSCAGSPRRAQILAVASSLLLAPIGALASCPAPQAGQPLPPEAQAEYLSDPTFWYWRSRMDQLEQDLAATDLPRVRLLFLGDSIIERWDHEVFDRHYRGLNALSLGVGGETTQGLLWRLPHLKLGSALRPELVVLLIGTNNTYPGGNAEALAIGIGEIVRSIHNLSATSRILLLGLLPRGKGADDGQREMATQVNGLIAACANNKTVFYADPGSKLAGPGSGVSQDIEADYLHPTPLGYAILSDALDGDIRRLLE